MRPYGRSHRGCRFDVAVIEFLTKVSFLWSIGRSSVALPSRKRIVISSTEPNQRQSDSRLDMDQRKTIDSCEVPLRAKQLQSTQHRSRPAYLAMGLHQLATRTTSVHPRKSIITRQSTILPERKRLMDDLYSEATQLRSAGPFQAQSQNR